jgi:Ca2+-binding RTX toxin-like protein
LRSRPARQHPEHRELRIGLFLLVQLSLQRGEAGGLRPTGTPGIERIGTNGPDNLVGTSGPDTLRGANGKDTLTGLGGDDTLDGGKGVDTAVYSGASADYTISRTPTGFTVSGPEGVDTLIDVERVEFADVATTLNQAALVGVASGTTDSS